MMFDTLTHALQRLLIPCLMAASAVCLADDTDTAVNQGNVFNTGAWSGEWQAENTTFVLRVLPEGNRFALQPVQPLGLDWTSHNGVINGNSGTINVEYQGITALVMVQLITHNSAIVRAMSCQPDYHVVCTLVHHQQAVFVKH